MKKIYKVSVCLCFLLITFFSQAQITLSQSLDPVNITATGMACWSNVSGDYSENSFMRVYNLQDFGVISSFTVTGVEYGQGSADDGKVVTIKLYTASSENLTTANLTLVQSTTHVSSSADDMSLVTVPISASIPMNAILVFELVAGDSNGNVGETFFPGFNEVGENDDSYIKSSDCGINVPTTTTTIGFSNNQYLMNVLGEGSLSVEDKLLQGVVVYPNPSSDRVNVSLPSHISDFSTEIYSMTGQLLKVNENESSLDISNLSHGIYLLKIITNVGVATKQITRS